MNAVLLPLVSPTSLSALGAMAIGFAVFILSLFFARVRSARSERVAEKRSAVSIVGVVIQMIGFAIVGSGPIIASIEPASAFAVAQTGAVVVLMALTIGLFVSAARAMGRNWSIVARTREDHELVTSGPFALIRHPIYTGLFAFMLALAIAFGHYYGLIVGVPLYWIGTWLRIVQEEKLLRAQFGAAYDAYAGRVRRFVPGVV